MQDDTLNTPTSPDTDVHKNTNNVKNEAAAEKSRVQSILEGYIALFKGPDRRSHILLWSMLAFVIIFFIWAKLAILDEVTHATGKVIPSQQIQVIQNLEGGIIRQILVREGQIVAPDEILMHIDDTRFASSYRESKMRRANLQADIARLTALATDKPLVLPKSLSDEFPKVVANAETLYAAQRLEMTDKISSLQQQVKQKQQLVAELASRVEQLTRSHALVNRELRMTKPLVKDGAVSEVEVLRLEREANDLGGELSIAKLSIPRAQAELDEAKNKIQEMISGEQSTDHDALKQIKAELSQLDESLTALEDRVVRTAVRSPVKGIVKQININTVGGVVQPGMDILEIVPLDDSLLIEARVKPKDIGFIHPGANAVVKFSAYDFSIYGGLKGNIELISADSMVDETGDAYYEIRVRTLKNHLGQPQNKLAIIPGMLANVDIITGQKSVLDYILKPILKSKQNALRER